MRRFILVTFLIAVAASFLMTGCTMTETPNARNRRIKQITDLQMRMLIEDWDYLWLYDRSTGMTQWHPWVGI